jgi:membrane associated rhomboid family serine protease
MQSEFTISREFRPGVKFIIITCCVMFFISIFPQLQGFINELSLYPLSAKIWQNLTYMFLHSNGFHLFSNMLGLFFIGLSVESRMGTKDFLAYFIICGLGAAVATHIFGLMGYNNPIVGASGAYYGILYACYFYYPKAEIYLYFVFPVKLKWLLLFLVAIDFLMLFDPTSKVAHFAHLGGLITGIIYLKYAGSVKHWQHERQKQTEIKEHEQLEDIKLKVDDILEKISKDGMGSLTPKEKKFLEKSSKRYRS